MAAFRMTFRDESQGLQRLSAEVERKLTLVKGGFGDFPRELGEYLRRQKLLDLSEGKGGDGKPFEKLSPRTLARRDGGGGPPLSPRLSASRVQAKLYVRVDRNPIRIHQGWSGYGILKYHVTGTKRMARRDPTGISPRARQNIGRFIKKRLDEIMGP